MKFRPFPVLTKTKILKLVAAVAGVLVLLLAWSYFGGGPARVIDVQLGPGPHHVGRLIPVQVTIDSSGVHAVERYVRTALPTGLELRQDKMVIESQPRLGGWRYTVILPFQAFDLKTFQSSEAVIGVIAGAEGDQDSVAVTIPEIEIVPRTETEAAFMGALSEDVLVQSTPSRWPYVLAAVALLVVGGLLLARRRKPPAVPVVRREPAWTIAERRLARLQEQLPLPAEEVLTRLTDIVRSYIEELYQIPATERTTPEFLEEIEQPGSPLGNEHRRLLRDFLQSADLVKFARMDATVRQLEDTIGSAKGFIVETSEQAKRQAAA